MKSGKKINKARVDELKNNQTIDHRNNRVVSRNRGRIGRRTKEMVDIAKERIRILLNLGEREILDNNNHARARRYVELARKIGMRYNIRLGKNYRGKICRKCNSYLITSAGVRVRCHTGRVIIVCKECGNIMRIPVHINEKAKATHNLKNEGF